MRIIPIRIRQFPRASGTLTKLWVRWPWKYDRGAARGSGVILLLLAAILAACGENPSYPQPQTDGLVKGLDGIYRDSDSNAFLDIPQPYRGFFTGYCAPCHSNLASDQNARGALNLNNWEQIKDYGPMRLLLIAKTHSMPLRPGPVPDSVLQRVQSWIAAGMPPDSGSVYEGLRDTVLAGAQYMAARLIISRYCADCHAKSGKHPSQKEAIYYFMIDDYAAWKNTKPDNILPHLQKVPPPTVNPMPPETYSPRISQAERDVLINWLEKGSPNTPDGK